MGWLGPILDTKLIPVLSFFTVAIAGQMNYWSIKNKTKWFSSNLNIWFALKRIHITLEITPGYIYAHRSASMAKRRDFIPQKNQKLSQNTNMFFQPVSDFYTLIMGLLVHSWFEIMEFSQILIIPAFWHWKMSV